MESPSMVFTKEDKKLVEEGEKWMKDTATSCTIAAALIATIAFAAVITVPSGINGTNGVPVFSKANAFIVFIVSDAISLFASTMSLLMFLSILTSRYAEGDFLYVLPKRLIIGLVTLFMSITTMMLAFSSTLLCLATIRNGYLFQWLHLHVYQSLLLCPCSFPSLWISSLQHMALAFSARKVIGFFFSYHQQQGGHWSHEAQPQPLSLSLYAGGLTASATSELLSSPPIVAVLPP
ncbi:hypothetical protein TEA_006353 [Camellia sinensis var. sinensis]|uniref:PGG domain-containing protein n=1 Tax=Camellia sinensis var. sinensis TaxID=542762 RepID=A0A4S4DL77_CAMSN|nr:hypothetical protein TEA_006353 [Camellia sinensis var. sinensis]